MRGLTSLCGRSCKPLLFTRLCIPAPTAEGGLYRGRLLLHKRQTYPLVMSVPLHLWIDLLPAVLPHVRQGWVRTHIRALLCKAVRTAFASHLAWRPSPAVVCPELYRFLLSRATGTSRIRAAWLATKSPRCRFAGGSLFGMYDATTKVITAARLAPRYSTVSLSLECCPGQPACIATDGTNIAVAYSNLDRGTVYVYNWLLNEWRSLWHRLCKVDLLAVNEDFVACHFAASCIAVFDVKTGEMVFSVRRKHYPWITETLSLVGGILVSCVNDARLRALWDVRGRTRLGWDWLQGVHKIDLRRRPWPATGTDVFCDGLAYCAETGICLGVASWEPDYESSPMPWAGDTAEVVAILDQ